MGKYSSDSDDTKRGKSSRGRRRSGSSDRGRSKHISSKKSSRRSKSRDKSRDKYSRSRRSKSNSSPHRSSRSRRSTSRERSKYRRSPSRDRHRRSPSREKRYRSKSRDRRSKSRDRRSKSRDRRSKSRDRRSKSRDRYRSRRSRSKDYIKEFVSKPKKRSSSSSSESSSDRRRKSDKRSTDNTKSKPIEDISKSITIKDDSPDCVVVDSETLQKINEDSFTPKQFTSTKSNKIPDNIVIDLKKNTIKVPEVEQIEEDSIFHHSLFLNEEARMEKWIKELYSYRQKALQQDYRDGH